MVQTSEGRRWLDRAAAGIRSRPDREAVRAELEAHLEDKTADLVRIFPDLGRQEAERQAVEQMGDAEEIGKELARLHRPWPRYLVQASRYCSRRASCGCWPSVCSGGMTPIWGTTTAPSGGTWTACLGRRSWGTATISAICPVGTWTRSSPWSPCLTASVNGQKISLLRAALWQREDGRQGLYCYLRWIPGASGSRGRAAGGMDDCDRQHRRSLRPGAGFPGGPGNGRTAERDEPNGLRALPQRL